MNKQLLAMMNALEHELLRDVYDGDLGSLDEDDLIELHDRVRRARNKYSKLYRRQAGAQVATDASRAKASAKNQRTRDKAEIFEDALARVSRRLAALARESAAELRTERLAAARRAGPEPGSTSRRRATGDGAVGDVGRSGGKTPASRKRTASTRATGARRQAKRNSR